MKKLISICCLLFFVVIGNAQENKKPKLSELNQDQLNLALKKSEGTIRIGKIITFVGVGAMIIGTGTGIAGLIMLIDDPDNNTAEAGGKVIIAGLMTTGFIGIPVWMVGAKNKKNITLELVKFNPKGSASINGIGLKIRF